MDLQQLLQSGTRQPAVQDLIGGAQEFVQGAQQIQQRIEQSQRSGEPYCMQLPQNQGQLCYYPPGATPATQQQAQLRYQ